MRHPGSAVAPGNRAPRRHLRRLGAVAAMVLAAVFIAPAATAHEDPPADVAAILDRVDPRVRDLSVEIHRTGLGDQFVVSNPTGRELVILSPRGDPFLRIGPKGVLANFRSPAWYESKVPSGQVRIPPEARPGRQPLWARVNQRPQWGWFDHRLHPPRLLDEHDIAGERPVSFGSWRVPVRYGDHPGALRGHYVYQPTLGRFTASVTPAQPAPGVHVTVLSGKQPGLLVVNSSGHPVTVLGRENEPFLRIGPDGTQANAASPTWWAVRRDGGHGTGASASVDSGPQWVPVSSSSRYAWSLARAVPEADAQKLARITEPTVVSRWTVTLRVDGERAELRGTTSFVPTAVDDRSGRFGMAVITGAAVALAVATAAIVLVGRRVVAVRARAKTPISD